MVIFHRHVSFRGGGYIKVQQVQRFHQKMIWKCGNQDDVDGLLSFLPGTHTWRTGVSIGLRCTCWTNGCNVNFQSERLTFNLIIRNGRGDMSFQKGEEKPAFWSSWNSLGTWFYNIEYDARFLANHACATSLGNFQKHGGFRGKPPAVKIGGLSWDLSHSFRWLHGWLRLVFSGCMVC